MNRMNLARAGIVALMCLSCTIASAQDSQLDPVIRTIRKSGDLSALPALLSGSASQHLTAGRVDRAAEQIDEAIDLIIKSKSQGEFQGILMIAGNVLGKLDGDRTKTFFNGLLVRAKESPKLRVAILETLGQRLLQSGDVIGAITVFQKAHQEISQSEPGSEAAFWIAFHYGQACVNGKLFDIGIPVLKQAKEIAVKLGRLELASATAAPIANACLVTREYETGEKIFREQLKTAIASKDENAICQAEYGLASILIPQKKLQEAEALLAQSIQRNQGSGKGTLRGMMQSPLALVEVARGNYAAAVSLAKEGIESKSADIPFLMRAFLGGQATMMDQAALASFELLAGNQSAAEKAAGRAFSGYRSSVSQAEKLAKQGVVNLDQMLTAYSDLPASLSMVKQQTFVDAGKIEQGLLEAENGRALAQLDAMRRNFGAEKPAESEKLSLEEIKQLAMRENVTFVEYSIIYPLDHFSRNLLGQAYPISAAKELFVWVVKPTGEVTFRRVALEQDLAEMVTAARRVVNPPAAKPDPEQEGGGQAANQSGNDNGNERSPDGSANKPIDLLHDISRIVVHPIEDLLPADPDQEVVIIPHGQLYALPYAALETKDGKTLIEKHTLVHASSIGAYKLSASRRGASGAFKFKDILIVGNPEMPLYQYRPDKPASPLDPLPGAEREAKAIGKMLGITPLIGQLAKESEVRERMKIAPVIHLASHGILQAENALNQPYLSAIALSPDEKENGFLTISEIMRMKLAADLAVMSACDSGRGKITGDGVVGLQRGYLAAGVPTVVVSLWPVSDAATAYLMVTFYDAMRNGQSKAAALRTAMLMTKQQYKKANLWAPFTIYGAGH